MRFNTVKGVDLRTVRVCEASAESETPTVPPTSTGCEQ